MLLTILKAPLKITALLLAFLLLLVQLACTLLLGVSSFVLNLLASLFLAGAVVLMLLLSSSSRIFALRSFSSGLRFLLGICFPSCLMSLFYTLLWRFTQNLGRPHDKRVLRICRAKKIKSTIKYRNHGCTRNASNPQYVAENVLGRNFHAPKPNVKWLTDVTEFKWYEGVEVHKIYLSAILDLYDRRIVSYVISEHNDNPIVFDTFKAAVKANPDAQPLFHSDRGFQYTNRTFHHMLKEAGMTQSKIRNVNNYQGGSHYGLLQADSKRNHRRLG